MGSLCLHRGGHRVARPREREEERVPLHVDLDAAVLAERVADNPPVFGDQLPVTVAKPLEERRRALDVRKDEGDGAGRQSRHATILTSPPNRPRSTWQSSRSAKPSGWPIPNIVDEQGDPADVALATR